LPRRAKSEKGRDEPNVFPGNWDVVSETLLKTYELWFSQNWSPVDLPWEACDSKNFSPDEAVAQAYWLSKLALFEKSGIGAFGQASVQAATHPMEAPTRSAGAPAPGSARTSHTGSSPRRSSRLRHTGT
jgi:hypothetical protein